MGVIIFNGKSSSDYGINVEHYPDYEIPERDYDVVHVPGKNGDIFVDKKSYKNVNRTYVLSSGSDVEHSFTSIMLNIVNWLESGSGYCTLSDTYEPDYYRKAMYNSAATFTNIHDGGARATISFNCKPQRYFHSGDVPVTFTSPGPLNNPTVFNYKPIITVYGRGYATLRVGQYVANLSMLTTSIGTSVGITRMKVNAQTFINKIGETQRTTFLFTCVGNSCDVEIVSSSSEPIAASVESVSDFITAVGTNKLKKYTFTYHEAVYDEAEELVESEYWDLDGVPIESLSDYSLLLTGVPQEGDSIIVRVQADWTLDNNIVDVGDYGITFSGPPEYLDTMEVDVGTAITIDSETMNCYFGDINKNQSVEFQNGFPELISGSNEISFTSNISSVEVVPKWWTL